MHYLSVCAVFRNEASYLAEWLRFYRRIGVEFFYLYDNESTDGSRRVAEAVVGDRARIVTTYGTRVQRVAYRHCLEAARGRTRWLGFFDLDEFCFSPTSPDLRVLLRAYERFPGVGANWVEFGSGGNAERPDGPVLRSYLRRGPLDLTLVVAGLLRRPDLDPADPASYWPQNAHIKSIVDPARTVECFGPHHFQYAGGALAVNAEERPIASAWSAPVSTERLRVNHYWSKSLAEFRAKLARGRADGHDPYDVAWALAKERRLNAVRDETILPFAE